MRYENWYARVKSCMPDEPSQSQTDPKHKGKYMLKDQHGNCAVIDKEVWKTYASVIPMRSVSGILDLDTYQVVFNEGHPFAHFAPDAQPVTGRSKIGPAIFGSEFPKNNQVEWRIGLVASNGFCLPDRWSLSNYDIIKGKEFFNEENMDLRFADTDRTLKASPTFLGSNFGFALTPKATGDSHITIVPIRKRDNAWFVSSLLPLDASQESIATLQRITQEMGRWLSENATVLEDGSFAFKE